MKSDNMVRSAQRLVLIGIFSLTTFSFMAGSAPAAPITSCIGCHGMPPLDASYRNISTGSFRGNHQTHQPAAATPANCTVCHPGSTSYTLNHRDGVIQLSGNIGNSPLAATYSKGVFFNQTSLPVPGSCANVNCHFEATTPAWGSAPLASPTGCATCHGAPPADGSHPVAGQKHGLYYGTTTSSCVKCHPDYTVTARPFAHATSAGKRGLLLQFAAAPNSGGTYSKTANLNYPAYLPSQTTAANRNGTCSGMYCHSNGRGGAALVIPAWGGALTCAGCHADMSAVASTAPNGGHYAHSSTANSTGPKLACATCHAGYTATASNAATHVNQQVELAFAATATTTYSKVSPMPAGGAWGTCSASKCHGTASGLVWGGALYRSGTDDCSVCHASTAAGAVSTANPFYSTSYPTKVTANTDSKVGAHTSHVAGVDSLSAALACTGCHASVTFATATHMNGATDFTWSALATTGGLAPTYTAATGVCANVYCHGAKMPGGDASGTNRAPTWNSSTYLPATLSAAACGTCHGFPPPTTAGHPVVTIPAGFPATATIGTTCSCHSNINTAGNSYANIFVNKALHINGTIEVSGGHSFPFPGSAHLSAAGTTPWGGCVTSACHANSTGGTYPVAAGTPPNCTGCHLQGLRAPSGTSSCWDCHGASATDGLPNGTAFPNIAGSHAIHAAIAGTTCATCHTGGGTGTAAHGSSNRVAATTASVKVVFTGQGASPLWTLAAKTCSAIYCHGQGAPTWGATSAAPVSGFPYSSVQCAKCHSGNLATDVTAAKPFYSTAIPQVTVNTNAKVGAHTSHLAAIDSLANAFTCADCHGTVTLTAATHMNGATNFTWSALATTGGLAPTYTAATGVCANVYCHGAKMSGGDISGTNRAPTWNSSTYLPATLSAAACAPCHGFPPPTTAGHPAVTIPAGFPATATIGTTCSCHANINTAGNSYANIFVNKALHINGILEVSGGHAVPNYNHQSAGTGSACTGCHAIGTATSVYPAAVAGNAPDCRGCHKKAAPGTATGTAATYGACGSCHGSITATTAITQGRPVGTAFPDRLGYHSGAQDGAHGSAACTVCHAGGGTGSGVNHGPGNRGTNPNVVGPMHTGITPTNGAKGVANTPVTCVHGTISGGCSGGGTKTGW